MFIFMATIDVEMFIYLRTIGFEIRCMPSSECSPMCENLHVTAVILYLVFATQEPKITPIVPQEQGFFDKRTDYEGIPIRANKVVVDEAMFEARRRMAMVLKNMPNATKNLVAAKAELDIIGRDQVTSDLPEFRDQKGKPFQGKPTEKVTTIDERGVEDVLHAGAPVHRGRDVERRCPPIARGLDR